MTAPARAGGVVGDMARDMAVVDGVPARATKVGRRHTPGPFSDGSRTLIMGVVNVTPDSFSDGGQWFEPDAAVTHGLALLADGADLLDVGGESTRPGAQRPTAVSYTHLTLPTSDLV